MKKEKEIYLDLFFMSKKEVTVADLYTELSGEKLKLEFWPDMGVLEVEFGEKEQGDFEMFRTGFQHPLDIEYVEQHKIKSIFTVNIKKETFEKNKKIFKLIANKFDGFFVSDTLDFQPEYHF